MNTYSYARQQMETSGELHTSAALHRGEPQIPTEEDVMTSLSLSRAELH
jgi:hypothetical protein